MLIGDCSLIGSNTVNWGIVRLPGEICVYAHSIMVVPVDDHETESSVTICVASETKKPTDARLVVFQIYECDPRRISFRGRGSNKRGWGRGDLGLPQQGARAGSDQWPREPCRTLQDHWYHRSSTERCFIQSVFKPIMVWIMWHTIFHL